MATDVTRQQPLGLYGSWKRKREQRKRLRRANRRSQVRFRLTREGANLVFVVVFIFVGAVLRDISLLILIAAAMIGLLLLQWRFNITTIARLHATRRVLNRVSQGAKAQCTLTISNSKRWVGAWLVIADDTIKKVSPASNRPDSHGKAIIDEISPQSKTEGSYTLVFHERGLYEVGPCTLSTRFPLGLGRGWRVIDQVDEVIVHPKLGELKPAFKTLLQNSRDGHHHSSAHVGVHEADFYGLRPWASGDSRRWIHWRTTARLGELSVRQFDRLEQQQSCLLLDLFKEPGSEDAGQLQACEKAISFVATLVTQAARSHGNKLSVCIAGDSEFCLTGIQSSVLGNSMLDRLATLSPSGNPNIAAALKSMTTALLANPSLIVVSTRPQASQSIQSTFTSLLGPKASTRLRIHWFNVSQGDLEPYFLWTSSE